MPSLLGNRAQKPAQAGNGAASVAAAIGQKIQRAGYGQMPVRRIIVLAGDLKGASLMTTGWNLSILCAPPAKSENPKSQISRGFSPFSTEHGSHRACLTHLNVVHTASVRSCALKFDGRMAGMGSAIFTRGRCNRGYASARDRAWRKRRCSAACSERQCEFRGQNREGVAARRLSARSRRVRSGAH